MRTLVTVTAVAAFAAIAVAAGASSALAHPGSTTTSTTAASSTEHYVGVVKRNGTTSYELPSTDSAVVHRGLMSGEKVMVTCYTMNQNVNGTPAWYRIVASNKIGFASAGNVHAEPGVPKC